MLTRWDQLAEIRPDAAFLDLGMPRVDGYAVARTVREAPWGHDIVLIAVTGWGQDQDKTRSAAAGFNHHLVKPLTVETLDALLPTIHPARPGQPTRRSWHTSAAAQLPRRLLKGVRGYWVPVVMMMVMVIDDAPPGQAPKSSAQQHHGNRAQDPNLHKNSLMVEGYRAGTAPARCAMPPVNSHAPG